MGARGPARTPSKILKLRDSRRANRNTDEPELPAGRPPCPKLLKGDAKKEWTKLVAILERMGILTVADENSIARYCKLWARWLKIERFLDKNGLTFDIGAGPRAYPEVKIGEVLSVQLNRLEQEFGLTPASRSRVKVIGGNPEVKKKKARGRPQKAQYFA